MRELLVGLSVVLLASGRVSAAAPAPPVDLATRQLQAAEEVLDAFYAFDAARLTAALRHSRTATARLTFYQGWAEAGHYRVLRREPCRVTAADEVNCLVTVRDDLIQALGTGYDVTDRFLFVFKGEHIVGASTSSNDPPEYETAMQWLRKDQPDLFKTGVCRPPSATRPATPGECNKVVVAGFKTWSGMRPK